MLGLSLVISTFWQSLIPVMPHGRRRGGRQLMVRTRHEVRNEMRVLGRIGEKNKAVTLGRILRTH